MWGCWGIVEHALTNILTLHQLSLFIWETTLGNRGIPDQSNEPYPKANGEQNRHARGPVRLRTFRYIELRKRLSPEKKQMKKKREERKLYRK